MCLGDDPNPKSLPVVSVVAAGEHRSGSHLSWTKEGEGWQLEMLGSLLGERSSVWEDLV